MAEQDRTNSTWKLDDMRPSYIRIVLCPSPVLCFANYIKQNMLLKFFGKFGLFAPNNLKARRWCIGSELLTSMLCFGIRFSREQNKVYRGVDPLVDHLQHAHQRSS
jgi:hypothetical protein